MESIKTITSVASKIYGLVQKVKGNKKRCQRVSTRIKALEGLLISFNKRANEQASADVERALQELCFTLESAQELITKYTSSSWVDRILKSNSHVDEFNNVNERLNDAFQALLGAEQVEQGNTLSRVFELSSRQKEDEEDRREDEAELKKRGFGLSRHVFINN